MDVAVVVPVYNSAEILPELLDRLEAVGRERFAGFQVVLVNDASPDSSWETIEELAESSSAVTGVDLRKNVGQDNAIMAGFHHAEGDVVVVMDDDLQHAPEDIPALVDGIREGADVVYARFATKRQALWKNVGSWLADRAAVWVLGKPDDVYMSPFKAVRREVVDELLRYGGPYPYVDGLIFTVTSRITQVDVEHHPRYAGRSNYDLRGSVRVWLKLVTSFSVAPLRLVTLLGGVISLLSLGMAAFFVIQTLVLERMPPGWPSLIVSVFFLGGVQLMGIGAIGEYVGRIFVTQNNRPQFTVRRVTGEGVEGGEAAPAADTRSARS